MHSSAVSQSGPRVRAACGGSSNASGPERPGHPCEERGVRLGLGSIACIGLEPPAACLWVLLWAGVTRVHPHNQGWGPDTRPQGNGLEISNICTHMVRLEPGESLSPHRSTWVPRIYLPMDMPTCQSSPLAPYILTGLLPTFTF